MNAQQNSLSRMPAFLRPQAAAAPAPPADNFGVPLATPRAGAVAAPQAGVVPADALAPARQGKDAMADASPAPNTGGVPAGTKELINADPNALTPAQQQQQQQFTAGMTLIGQTLGLSVDVIRAQITADSARDVARIQQAGQLALAQLQGTPGFLNNPTAQLQAAQIQATLAGLGAGAGASAPWTTAEIGLAVGGVVIIGGGIVYLLTRKPAQHARTARTNPVKRTRRNGKLVDPHWVPAKRKRAKKSKKARARK